MAQEHKEAKHNEGRNGHICHQAEGKSDTPWPDSATDTALDLTDDHRTGMGRQCLVLHGNSQSLPHLPFEGFAVVQFSRTMGTGSQMRFEALALIATQTILDIVIKLAASKFTLHRATLLGISLRSSLSPSAFNRAFSLWRAVCNLERTVPDGISNVRAISSFDRPA
jgi:hypothetical protein